MTNEQIEEARQRLREMFERGGWKDRKIDEDFYFYLFDDMLLAIEARDAPKGEKYLWTGQRWAPSERLKFKL